MKKLICLLLSLAMLCFVGCSEEESVSSAQPEVNSEIKATVLSGKFEGMEYGIGDAAGDVRSYYYNLYQDYQAIHTDENAQEGHEDELHIHDFNSEDRIPYYKREAKGIYNEVDTSDFRFYYETENEAKGIVAIATDLEVFGFTMGITTKQEVEKAMGIEGDTLNASEEDLTYLAFASEGLMILRYEFENRVLDFYFYENAIVTTVIRAV